MTSCRAIVTFGLVMLFLIPVVGLTNLQTVKGQGQGFTINADGTVSPSSAPIQEVGSTYYLKSNIEDTITIHKSNIMFEGNGYEIAQNATSNYDKNDYVAPYAVRLDSIENVTVQNLIISNPWEGIELDGSSNITIKNNTIVGQVGAYTFEPEPTAAISINDGTFNVIEGNNLKDDSIGVDIVSFSHAPCWKNLIVGNNFTDCYRVFLIYDSSNNSIYHNNFIGNSFIVTDMYYDGYGVASVNVWDDGFPAGGNYWGYQTGDEINNTGISATPYEINTQNEKAYPQNEDRYPLIRPFNSAFLSNYEQEITPPQVSVLSPSNKTYSTTDVSFEFSINKPFNWVAYSLDGQQNVTVNGNDTISNIVYGSHSITVYANSTFGIVGLSKPIEFSVAKPELFPFVAIIATVVVIIVAVVVAGFVLYRLRRKKLAPK